MPRCEGILVAIDQVSYHSHHQDHVTVHEYFVLQDGEEIRETAELVKKVVSIQEQPMVSMNESWISTKISLRSDIDTI